MGFQDQYNPAREKYFAQNPAVVAEINSVSSSVIEACGLTVEEYREQRRVQAFASAAEARGMDPSELVILLMADTPEQAKAWRLEQHRAVADALGMEWSEYISLNRIEE
jgi:hypothetical protein